jgi:hypothetical protein
MDGKIFNSIGEHVGRVLGLCIFDCQGDKLYDLKGANIYRLTGELVGYFSADRHGSEKHLDKSADKLFR